MSTPTPTDPREEKRVLSSAWLMANAAPDDLEIQSNSENSIGYGWFKSHFAGKVVPTHLHEWNRYRTARTDLPPEAFAESTNSKLAAEIARMLASNGQFRSDVLFAIAGTREQLPDEQIIETAKSVAAEIAELKDKQYVANEHVERLGRLLQEARNIGAETLIENMRRGQQIDTMRAELEAARKERESDKAKLLTVSALSVEQLVQRHLDLLHKSTRENLPPGFDSWDAYHKYITAALAAKDAAEKENKELREREGQLVIKWEAQQDRANQLDSKLATLCAAKEKRVAEALPIISDALSELSLTLANTERRESADCRLAAYLKVSRASELIAALTPAPTQEPHAGVSPWRPIETAPTDGKIQIMIAEFRDGELIDIDFDAILEQESESWEMPQTYWIWKSAHGRVENPTHWQPIIPPAGGVTISNETVGIIPTATTPTEASPDVSALGAEAASHPISTEKKGGDEPCHKTDALAEDAQCSPEVTHTTALVASNSPADVRSVGRGEWMPIETCPDDGSKFLMWVSNAYGSDHIRVGLFRDGKLWWIYDTDEELGHVMEIYATHWQPLPPPPMLPTEGSGA